MKPAVPNVSMETWKNLYAAAERVKALKPWQALGGTDLIGVRDPASGATGFGCFMGSEGTLFGFVLYRGAEGFAMYRRLVEDSFDFESEDFFALQNCLKLDLGERSDLEREDHAVIKQLGLAFKGKTAWPQFRSLVPAYAPWFLNEEEARFLTLGLNAGCRHLERIVSGEIGHSARDGECLMYEPLTDSAEPNGGNASEKFSAQWEPLPILEQVPAPPPVLNLARINAIRAKQTKPDSPWEADVFFLPSAVYDAERPYFIRLAAICQHASGLALTAEPAAPEMSAQQILADAICTSVERHGFLPETVFVKRAEYAAALAPLGKALGISIRERKRLGAVRGLKAGMMGRM